jgi:hypothetical protein
MVDALRDVRRLLVERDDHSARLGVEAVLCACNRSPRIRSRTRRGMSTYVSVVISPARRRGCRDQRLAGDAALRVLGENGVEDGVRDLVGDLVRMALGDRLGREAV